MPRIRTLKPEHKTHRKVGPLDDRSYRLWVGLVTEADDQGRFIADPEQLRVTVFPYQRLAVAKLEASLQTLAATGLIGLYRDNGCRYGVFWSWTDHQKISHPAPSSFPTPPEDSGGLQNPLEDSGGLANPLEDSGLARARGSDRIGLDRIRSGGEAPSPRAGADSGAAPPVRFHIPDRIRTALSECPHFRAVPRLQAAAFWQSQIRARGTVDFPAELLKAEGWIVANPTKAPKSDYPAFLNRWFKQAAERSEEAG
jgi:hypothetical protein